MSRIGKQSIDIPEKVKVKLDGQKILVDGPKGSLTRILPSLVCCSLDEQTQKLVIEKTQNTKLSQALYGLSRTLVSNMVVGVSDGFEKRLQITGVGYRAQVQGSNVNLTLGFSHPVVYKLPHGVTAETPSQTEITLKSADKQLLGQVAAEIRAFRPPEPYKGKGVRYSDEYVRRKEAKKK